MSNDVFELETGEIALLKYNKLRFSFSKLKAGDAQILTSDPWSLINSELQNQLHNCPEESKIFFKRALYFSSLAESFYKAANNILLPTKATLLYYGMLNLVKCFLSIKHIELETVHEHHGLTLPLNTSKTIEIKPATNQAVYIFSKFSELLGQKINSSITITFEEAIQNIPEIHSISHSLDVIKKRSLLPIQVSILTDRNTKSKLFSEIRFEKEQETKVDITKFLKHKRKTYFMKDDRGDNLTFVYQSKIKKTYNKNTINEKYQEILNEYKDFDLAPILTSTGYRYYVALNNPKLPHLSYSLLCMFYLGSIARYRPSEADSLLKGTLRPIISEFVNLSPNQFLYQLCSIFLEKECVMPFSSSISFVNTI